MKAFTDISQSKKLAEILPFESADMCFNISQRSNMPPLMTPYSKFNEFFNMKTPDFLIPCWSLAALLNVLPDSIYDNTYEFSQLEFTKKSVAYMHGATDGIKIGALKDNLVDACYEIILRLHELKML